jgi:hypothetical protein
MHVTKAIWLMTGLYAIAAFQKPRTGYEFYLSADRTRKTPQNINVHIINHSTAAIYLNNLVFDFYVDDEGFWGTWEKVRFVKKDLILASNQTFNTTVRLDSLTIVDYKGRTLSVKELQDRIQRGKKVKIKASISDMRRLADNPMESSSLVWSNSIDY